LLGRRRGRAEVQIAKHHSRALCNEPLGDGVPETLRTAGDYRVLIGQQRHLITPFRWQALSRAWSIEHHISYMISGILGPTRRRGARRPPKSATTISRRYWPRPVTSSAPQWSPASGRFWPR